MPHNNNNNDSASSSSSSSNGTNFEKVGIIFNPAANKGEAKQTFDTIVQPLLNQHFSSRIFKVYETKHAGDGFNGAVELWRDDGCDLLVACGGDGTLHEVVNGLMKSSENDQKLNSATLPAVAVVPLGTSDDFATHINLSPKCYPELTREKAYEQIIRSISSAGKVLSIDIGSVTATKVIFDQETQTYQKSQATQQDEQQRNQEFFINESSCGISADVIDTVNRAANLWHKALFNPLQGLMKQFTYQNREMQWRLTNLVDKSNNNHGENDKNDVENVQEEEEEVIEGSGMTQMFVMGNGQYFGNGMKVCPDAKLNDGQFQCTHLSNVNWMNALSIIPKLFKGTQSEHEKVTHYTAQSVDLDCVGVDKSAIVLVEADGEIVGSVPASWSLRRNALRIVVPARHPMY